MNSSPDKIKSAIDVALSLFTIAVIAVFPHFEITPFFSYTVPILLLVILILKRSGEKISDFGLRFKGLNAKAVLIGITSAILILAFMQLVFFPTLDRFVSFEEETIGLYEFIKANPFQLTLMIIMGWLVGGVYEEIVFHGFIFTRFEKMIPGKYNSLLSFLVTASIFGVYHYQLGLAGLINAFIVGMVYLGLYVKFNRNLWYPIIAHGTYNSIVMVLIYMEWL